MFLSSYPRLTGRGKILGFVAALGAVAALEFFGLLQTFDLKLLDSELVLLRTLAPRPVPREVVVVGIDEATVRALPEPMSLWHRHLGRFMQAMAQAGPAVVGMDVVFPDRSFDAVLAGYDKALLAGMLELRRTAPLVLAMTLDAAGKPRDIYPPFVSAAGEDGVGLALLRADRDQVIRRFDERLADDGSPVPTLAGGMARRLGVTSASGLIDFSRGESFRYVPLITVLRWADAGDAAALARAFHGKPVLLGTVLPFEDRLRVPVALAAWEPEHRLAPGVLLQAQALRSMLGEGLLGSLPLPATLLLTVAAAALWFAPLRPAYALGAVVVLTLSAYAAATLLLYRGWWWPAAGFVFSALIAPGARAALGATQQARERQRLRRAFGGYVSPEIMREIVDGRLAMRLGGDRVRICVMFADIRDFTARSETMAPEAVITLLNRYFERITEAIHQRGGTVDKFMGDGIMAFFGAPQPLERPGRAAFFAAREMLARLADINLELEREGVVPIRIGIGLHLGEAVVGLVGSTTRHEYTAIGDAVNVAARLEQLTKEAGYALVCSRPVRDCLEDDSVFVYLGQKSIKGHTPVDVYGWRESGPQLAAVGD